MPANEPSPTTTTTGAKTTTEWRRPDGTLHRVDGPAVIAETTRKEVLSRRDEKWYVDGELHNTDGPARVFTSYRADGTVDRVHREWRVEGRYHRDDGPAHLVEAWPDEGSEPITTSEEYHVDGRHHRLDGPAKIVRNPRRGTVDSESWYRDGTLHRPGGEPASVAYHDDGRPKGVSWYDDEGKLHRADGPASITYDADGRVTSEQFAVHGTVERVARYHPDGSIALDLRSANGALHRTDGPARLVTFDDGTTAGEEYYVEGNLHRTDGPAAVDHHEAPGHPRRSEQYRLDGRLHRTDGPAFTGWTADGTVSSVEYWIDGRRREGDEPAVIAYDAEGAVARRDYWSDGRCRIERVEGRKPTRLSANPLVDGGDVSPYNHLRGEDHRVWHRTCLGLRNDPDICFFFEPGQPRAVTESLLAYFPHPDELADRIIDFLEPTTDRSDDATLRALAVEWCAEVRRRARLLGHEDAAVTIDRLLTADEIRLLPFREAHERLRGETTVDQALLEEIQDATYEIHLGNGGSMLRESLYQMSTWYQPVYHVLAPLSDDDYDWSAWVRLHRLNALVVITEEEILLGHSPR